MAVRVKVRLLINGSQGDFLRKSPIWNSSSNLEKTTSVASRSLKF